MDWSSRQRWRAAALPLRLLYMMWRDWRMLHLHDGQLGLTVELDHRLCSNYKLKKKNSDCCGNLYHPALKTILQQKVWIFYNSNPFSVRRRQYFFILFFFLLFSMFSFFVFSIKRNREFCPVLLNYRAPGEAPLSMTFSDLSKLSNLL